ncbi:MAG: glycosyltransferase [Prevotella sp.]
MIGLFNECFPPVMDGVSITVYNLAQQFYKAGEEVSVITPSCPGLRSADYPFDLYTYFSLPVPIRPPYRCGMPFLDLKFQRTLEEVKFDVVHAHSPFSDAAHRQQ